MKKSTSNLPPSCELLCDKKVDRRNEELSTVCLVETKDISARKSTSLPPSYWGEDSRKYSKDK